MKKQELSIISIIGIFSLIGIATIGWDTSGGFPPNGSSSQYLRGDRTWQILNSASVGLNNVENTALSSWVGNTKQVSVGTITTGKWQGSVIADAYISSSSTWNNKANSGANTDITSLGACNSVTSSDILTLATSGTNKDIILTPTGVGGLLVGTSTKQTKLTVAGGGYFYNPQCNIFLNDTSAGGSGTEQSQIVFRKNDINKGSITMEHSTSFLRFMVGDTTTVDAVMDTAGKLRLGDGTAPTYLIDLLSDSAGKPGAGGLWTITSDERIKKNIRAANLKDCWDIVNSVPLKRFEWADGVYTDKQVKENDCLGWLAKDVQKVLPCSVSVKPFTKANGEIIKDCLDLNAGQLNTAAYGALQLAMQRIEELEKAILNLKQKIH